MLDDNANARHRIDASKTLNDFCNGPGASAPASDRFIISIILNSDVLRFDKSRTPDPNDVDPNHPDDMPMIAAIAGMKTTEDGSGGHI